MCVCEIVFFFFWFLGVDESEWTGIYQQQSINWCLKMCIYVSDNFVLFFLVQQFVTHILSSYNNSLHWWHFGDGDTKGCVTGMDINKSSTSLWLWVKWSWGEVNQKKWSRINDKCMRKNKMVLCFVLEGSTPKVHICLVLWSFTENTLECSLTCDQITWYVMRCHVQ